MSKIIICGLNGSGKTTLGEELSKRIGYVHKDIEMYYFNSSNNNRYRQSRSKDDVIKDLENDFKKYDNIVFTACKGDYGRLNDLYDFAIYIRLDKDTRLIRVKERTFKQFGNKVLEDSELYQQETKFWEMAYNRDETPIINWFENLKCPKLEIDGHKPVAENIAVILNNFQLLIG